MSKKRPVAESKSQFRRMTAQGADPVMRDPVLEKLRAVISHEGECPTGDYHDEIKHSYCASRRLLVAAALRVVEHGLDDAHLQSRGDAVRFVSRLAAALEGDDG